MPTPGAATAAAVFRPIFKYLERFRGHVVLLVEALRNLEVDGGKLPDPGTHVNDDTPKQPHAQGVTS